MPGERFSERRTVPIQMRTDETVSVVRGSPGCCYKLWQPPAFPYVTSRQQTVSAVILSLRTWFREEPGEDCTDDRVSTGDTGAHESDSAGIRWC